MLGVPQFLDNTTGSLPRSEISSHSTCLTLVALTHYHGSDFSYYSGVANEFFGGTLWPLKGFYASRRGSGSGSLPDGN